jgi:hypothetical protein
LRRTPHDRSEPRVTRWHPTFEALQEAVSAVLDHVEDYQDELITLMTEKFQRHPKAKAA